MCIRDRYSGVSNVFSELPHSQEAYRESLEALKNNELLKKDSEHPLREKYDLVFYSDFTGKYKNTLYCNLTYEAQIRLSLIHISMSVRKPRQRSMSRESAWKNIWKIRRFKEKKSTADRNDTGLLCFCTVDIRFTAFS